MMWNAFCNRMDGIFKSLATTLLQKKLIFEVDNPSILVEIGNLLGI